MFSARHGHASFFLDRNGNVWALGCNLYEQLGVNAERTSVHQPIQVPQLQNIVSISSGNRHTIALDKEGEVWVFGNNEQSQLGLSPKLIASSLPVKLTSVKDIQQVSCGSSHTLLLDHTGMVFSCGENAFGQVGSGDFINLTTPTPIASLPEIISVSAGWAHSVLLDHNHRVWTFGKNNQRQLGLDDLSAQPNPVHVSEVSDIQEISAGWNHTILRMNDQGDFIVFGSHFNGRQIFRDNARLQIFHVPDVCTFQAAGNQTVFLDIYGDVWVIGKNSSGQLGTGDCNGRTTPKRNPLLQDIVAVSPGWYHTLILDQSGNIYGFGKNNHGQLSGAGDSLVPKLIPLEISLACKKSIPSACS
jgi:alpha-tubulin suppressor-like RCC1 family protein